jgi:hypothetical protein
VDVAVVANVHRIHLVLNIPLKPANRQFTLFEIITLPVRVSSDRFAQYSLDYMYFGLQHNQQTYILLTETDSSRCKKSNFATCPADTAIYHVHTFMCNPVYTFRQPVLTEYVAGSFCSTTINRFSIAMERVSYITSHHHVKLHCTAPTTAKKYLIANYSTALVQSTLPHVTTLLPVRYNYFLNYTRRL